MRILKVVKDNRNCFDFSKCILFYTEYDGFFKIKKQTKQKFVCEIVNNSYGIEIKIRLII